MNKSEKNRALGLSAKELSSAVLNSGDPNAVKGLSNKINNCDLSSSALELVNEEDLEAISRISERINTKYLGAASFKWGKILLVFGVSLLAVLTYFYSGFNQEEVSIDTSVQEIKQSNVVIHSKDSVDQKEEEAIEVEKEDRIVSSDIVIKQKSEPPVVVAKKERDSTVLEDPVDLESREETGKNESPDVKGPEVRAVRRVRGVKANKGVIAPKYKGDSYSFSDLVQYDGGVEVMEKDLFKLLIGKVSDSDIPSKHSTIVFNFNVTHRGKVKDVSIQSVVSPELEVLLKEAVLSLSSWTKGSKRISKNYTVYVTFK